MTYSEAFAAMERGELVTLPGWGEAYLRLIKGRVALCGAGRAIPYTEPEIERMSALWAIRSRNKPAKDNSRFRKGK